MMTAIPSNIEQLTPEVMTALLSKKQPGIIVEKVEITEHAQCGDGLASTADRVGLKLHYQSSSNSTGIPENMKLKTILLHRFLRFGMPMIMGTARVVNALEKVPLLGRLSGPFIFTLINIYQRYFPHAPEAMYRNEVNFYDKLRKELDIEAPDCYASVMNEHDGQFGILMEDLGLRSARFPNAIDGVSLDEMRSLIENLAKLHAHFWQSPRLDGDLNWLPKTFEGGMFPVFDSIGLNIIRNQVETNPFKQNILAPLNRTVDQLWHAMWKSQHLIYQQPHTLLHGDTHIGNTYVLPDGKGGLLDWQLIVRGPWCHDITYMMITGLDINVRRQHEKELLNLYRETLLANGVKNVPSEEQAYLLYRQSAIWGLVIGWLITPPQNYGEAITSANIQKMVTAMIDLKTLESLEA
jgi:hypothetical protein